MKGLMTDYASDTRAYCPRFARVRRIGKKIPTAEVGIKPLPSLGEDLQVKEEEVIGCNKRLKSIVTVISGQILDP